MLLATLSNAFVSPRLDGVIRSWALLLSVAVLWAINQAAAGQLPARWRWSNPPQFGGNIFDMAYGLGLTVAVAERGQIYTSEDLALWEPQDSHTTNS
ncbi:MAG: hypothetical protein DME25_18450, partial [Verrucomicrobia bacterium]